MVRRILSPDDLPEKPFDADRTFARCVAAGLLLGLVFIVSEESGCGKPKPALCLVEPFPAPTSPQERPEPADVSAHGSGRQGGTAGLSFPTRGTE